MPLGLHRHRRRAILILSLGAALVLSAGTAAQPNDANAHYSRDRPVDFLDMRLAVTFTDEGLRAKSCEGRVEYTLRPRGRATSTVALDAVDMRILGVELPGEPQAPAYGYDDRTLTVVLPRQIEPEETFRLAVRYRVEDPAKGLHFSLPNASAPDRPVMVYTQSEALEGRYWVPTHDWPNERWTSEVAVTVPSPYTVVSNGVLTSRTADGDAATFVWRNEIPTISHHMGFVVGELVELRDRDSRDGKAVRIYALPGLEDVARAGFARVPEMIDFFTERVGVEMPYPGYAHVTVPGHHHGGMEHAGYSLLDPRFLSTGPDGEMPRDPYESGFIAHMLAHQWFGGLVNYRSLPRVWLNEGFGSYLHMLWEGRRDTPEDFEHEMWTMARTVTRFDTSEDGRPLADRYTNADDVFRYDGLKVYWKGAWVLHMLRRELGDELFWHGVRTYLDAHRFDSAESSDLRRALSEVSGLDLEQFFRQWVHGHGVPRLEVDYAWDPALRQARVAVSQTQKIDAETPAFAAALDLFFGFAERGVDVTVDLRERRHEFTFDFAQAPDRFVVDPRQRLLKTLAVDMPRTLWIEQALRGPTATARMEATEHLAGEPRPEAVRTLAAVLADPAQFWGVRTTAAAGLGAMGRDDALAALLESAGAGHPKVRAAVLTALGRYPASTAAHEILLGEEDADVEVAAAALRALGGMRAEPALVERGVERLRGAVAPSSRRWVRRSAFAAISRLGDPRHFDALVELARPGRGDELRDSAIRALGAVAAGREDLVLETLRRWLDDPDPSAQRAAASALARLEDPRALADLERLAESARERQTRQAARTALEAIRQGADPDDATAVALERLDAADKKNRELEKRLTELERRIATLLEPADANEEQD